MDDPAQQVEALLGAPALVATVSVAAASHRGLGALEDLVGHERLVAAFGLDPLLALASDERPLALLDLPEVEPVPVEAPGVDGFSSIARMVVLAHLPAVLRLASTWLGGGGPPGRLRWLAISLKPQPAR